ncbi:4787_t:CDS:2, partial [Funneliformis mosseae]
SEDAQEWIEIFLRVKEANGWPDNRRVAISARMLKEEAADWYNLLASQKSSESTESISVSESFIKSSLSILSVTLS